MTRAFLVMVMSIGLLIAAIRIATGQEESTSRPLDLPAVGAGGIEDDEIEPESIRFYGAEYEGDAFFWCLDRSCSMGWAGGAPLATLKQEMNDAIRQLSRRTEFGIVSYSENYTTWRSRPVLASESSKFSAISYVNEMEAVGWTCIAEPMVVTLNIAVQARSDSRVVILVGDGRPECGEEPSREQDAQALSDITTANYSRIPIHTIWVAYYGPGSRFMAQLASMNDGTFRMIQ